MTMTTDPAVPITAEEIADRLAAVRAELGMIARAPFAALDEVGGRQVVVGIEQVTRGLEGLQDAAVGGLEAGQSWATSGYRTFPVWWSAQTHRRASTGLAAQHQARDLRKHLPLTAEALAEGRIGGEHVRVLTRFVTKTEAQQEQLRDPNVGEAFLVDQAERLSVEMYTRLVKEWAICADPEAADRGWREEGAREELFLSQVLDGADLRGWLSTESWQVVDEALRAAVGTPAAGDDRTPAQRRAAALVHVCRSHLDRGEAQPGARIRPHLAITVDATTLAALLAASGGARPVNRDVFGQIAAPDAGGDGLWPSDGGSTGCSEPRVVIPATLDYRQLRGVAPASFADGTPVPHGQLAKLLCDGEFHRVVFGPDGQILDSGRPSGCSPRLRPGRSLRGTGTASSPAATHRRGTARSTTASGGITRAAPARTTGFLSVGTTTATCTSTTSPSPATRPTTGPDLRAVGSSPVPTDESSPTRCRPDVVRRHQVVHRPRMVHRHQMVHRREEEPYREVVHRREERHRKTKPAHRTGRPLAHRRLSR